MVIIFCCSDPFGFRLAIPDDLLQVIVEIVRMPSHPFGFVLTLLGPKGTVLRIDFLLFRKEIIERCFQIVVTKETSLSFMHGFPGVKPRRKWKHGEQSNWIRVILRLTDKVR
jgi:hypothetical protein